MAIPKNEEGHLNETQRAMLSAALRVAAEQRDRDADAVPADGWPLTVTQFRREAAFARRWAKLIADCEELSIR